MTPILQDLSNRLGEAGIKTFEQTPGQLVITKSIPNTPDQNSFWVAYHEQSWYLSTWLPALYLVPKQKDISAVCSAVLSSSPKAIYTIDEETVTTFGLIRLTDQEADSILAQLFGESEDEDECPPE